MMHMLKFRVKMVRNLFSWKRHQEIGVIQCCGLVNLSPWGLLREAQVQQEEADRTRSDVWDRNMAARSHPLITSTEDRAAVRNASCSRKTAKE